MEYDDEICFQTDVWGHMEVTVNRKYWPSFSCSEMSGEEEESLNYNIILFGFSRKFGRMMFASS